jgi:hypothetical protein
MKLYRNCRFVLLVKTSYREGKALGTEEVKAMSRGELLDKVFTDFDRKFYINIRRAALKDELFVISV